MAQLARKKTEMNLSEPNSETGAQTQDRTKRADREPQKEDEPQDFSIMMFNRNFGKNPSFKDFKVHTVLPPEPVPGIPPGLELMIPLNYLSVKRRTDSLPPLMIRNAPTSYELYDAEGHRLYFAVLSSKGRKSVQCFGSHTKPFEIDILDYTGRIVVRMKRPYNSCLYLSALPCFCWIFGSCGGTMTVYLGEGVLLGKIIHKYGCFRPKYEVRDLDDEIIMTIRGPACADCCLYGCCTCDKSEFQVTDSDGLEIGVISQIKYVRPSGRNLGYSRRLESEASDFHSGNFGVVISFDLDTRHKALIVAASFLIHHMYYHDHDEQAILEEEMKKDKDNDSIEDDQSDITSQF